MSGHSFKEADSHFVPTEAAPLEPLGDYESEPASQTPAALDDGTVATFLYARVHNFSAACQTMGAAELTSFVNEVRRILSAAALDLGGEIAQRRPDSILCVFSHNPSDRVPTDAKRALHAAILTVHECVNLAARVAARPQAAGTPALSMAVGVHLGVAEVTPRAVNKSHATVHAAGEAVEIARLLEVVAADMHWSVVASLGARQAGGTRVDAGRCGTLGLPDDSFLEVVEITGLVPRKGSTTPQSHYESLRESLRKNQQLSRSAVQGAGHMVIEDYRLIRKIGEGGNATIYLAQPFAGGPTQVLKVLRPDNGDRVMGLQRFIQEFALLAGIEHPNVARIFKQGFSGDSAYIAMEYFPVGDLRSRMVKAMDPGVALYYLRQIASGLEAIHQVGIVHRDLKPDNVMMRQDGIVAIADFGVAKQVSMQITDTGAGESVGTPYYLSPEQALGRPVDARSDIYSLGVVAYEMLTGSKPYRAETAQALLQLHVSAPVPVLPPSHRKLQPVLDRMMAKDPAGRYASASELLDALEALGA
ncbi:MAG: protein kinase [Ramlibacter sp.]|nr:protein kinase [Ramlibacter sp.]MBX3660362.1 protein kinase [Ramlibacter sp.]MCW5651826.1 protein kinase [Ramlibacter sp.]